MAVRPVPEGYHSITSCLSIKGAVHALDFYKQAFGVTEFVRMDGPNGTIAYAKVRIGDSPIVMSDEALDTVCVNSDTLQSTSMGLTIYVFDVDTVFAGTLKAGGTEVRPAVDQLYGGRSGALKDPFGHVQTASTHVEDVAPGEMARRVEKQTKEQAAAPA